MGAAGFVLARSGDGAGPVCWWQGRRCHPGPASLGPFSAREDAAIVVRGIDDVMRMPSAGDLVIYGCERTRLRSQSCGTSAQLFARPRWPEVVVFIH